MTPSIDSLKAILLAGGHGVRAKPFTDYLPKALIPLDGRPVIDYVVRYLAKFPEISDLNIVCEFDRFGKQIINYFEGKETLIGKSITFIEDKKNGTGGALLRVEKNLRQGASQNDDACFLVWFADNLCALKIDDMIRKYDMINNNNIGNTGYKGAIVGMVVVRDKRFEETGRVVLETGKNCDYTIGYDNNDIAPIKEFVEKGKAKLERPEAVGIYLFSKRIFDYLHNESIGTYDGLCFDLSHDILEQIPRIGGKLFSFNLGENIEWIDIESPAYAERHKDVIKKVLSQMDIL